MKTALVGTICLVLGLVIGTLVGGPMMLGRVAGVGVATGLGAGICSTVAAAQAEGVMTAEQVDQVLTRATTDLGGTIPEDQPIVGSAAQCDEVLAKLREAVGK